MKILKYLFASILIILFCFFLLSQIGKNIPEYTSVVQKTLPIKERKDIDIMTIHTGSFETLEGFLFAGGNFFKVKKGAHNATLILHPKGNLLIDTGLGKNVDVQFDEMPLILKPLFKFIKGEPVFDILKKNNISVSSILLTHMHWDHASGLKDFNNPQIFTTREEYNFSESDEAKPPAYVKSQYSGLNHFQFIEFSSGAYEVFEKSFDFYKDGSIIIVELGGHSPGSIGIFVNRSADERYFFTGDLTWALEGFQTPAHKFIISSLLVDKDRNLIKKEIGRVAHLMKLNPEIKIIPAHDFNAFENFKKLK